MDILVTYDIDTTTPSGERRLNQIAGICESFGVRRQYSVFECRLSSTRVELLKQALREAIDPATDTIDVYRFPGDISNSRETLGHSKSADLGSGWIV